MRDWPWHTIVLTQENRSFDQIYGHYKGVDGIPKGICLPARAGPCVAPYPVHGCLGTLGFGPPHSFHDVHCAVDGGKMDGFVRVGGRQTMGYFKESKISGYRTLATKGLLLDRFFASVLGPTLPNRLFAISGQSPIKNNPPMLSDAAAVSAGSTMSAPLVDFLPGA